MKRLFCFLVVFAVVFSALVSCDFSDNGVSSDLSVSDVTSDEPQPFPVTVRDVTVGEMPTRVVSLSPVLTDLICGYGYEDRLVGRSTNCMFSTSVLRLPDVGTAAEPKLEEIIMLEPQYVFTTQELSEDTVSWLSKNNIAVINLPHPTSVRELTGIYSDLAVIFEGKTQGLVNGAKNAKAFNDRLDELKLKIEKHRKDNSLTDAVTILFVHSLNNYIAAGETLENDILEYIGIGNAAADSSGYFVSDDSLKSINPHYIVISAEVDAEELSLESAYKAKTAVKNGDIISVDVSAIERCSTGLLSVFYEIAETMYPGVSEINLSEPSQETISE